ncbi:MAG: glycosyltransferase [Chloroflexota bacterium]
MPYMDADSAIPARPVSVIVPVLKDRRVARLLDSLQTQTFPEDQFEVIVVDNSGDGEIRRIVARYNYRYLVERPKGSYAARNAGLAHASGQILAFTDADCIADSAWLESLVEAFTDEQIGGVGGTIVKTEGGSWVQRASFELQPSESALQFLPFSLLPYAATANVAYRAGVLRQIAGFDTSFKSGGDVDISWRVGLSGYWMAPCAEAVIHHEMRPSLAAYFGQYLVYGLEQVQLFGKHRGALRQRSFTRGHSIRDLRRACLHLLRALSRKPAAGRTRFHEVQLATLRLTISVALLCGRLMGCIKYRVLYL